MNTRDPPDFQELLITACKCMVSATQRGVRPGRARGRSMGWEKHLKRAVTSIFFFFHVLDGRNLSPEKLFLKPPDAFKIKNNGPHDKPSAAFTTKEMPDVFFSADNSFHALLCYVKLGFLLTEQRHFLLDYTEVSL